MNTWAHIRLNRKASRDVCSASTRRRPKRYRSWASFDHTIELWSIPTIKNLVKNNVGISYLPTFTVEEELGTGELEAIHTDIGDKTITAVCAHHKNKWLSPLMQLFIDLCVSISA